MDLNQSGAFNASGHITGQTLHKPGDGFRQAGLPPTDRWEDVTAIFRKARKQMDVGELIHLDSFNLHMAMSAIELMDPKMDIGCGDAKDVSEVVLPTELSNSQVIDIMDQLLVCFMSWLDGHTLPQTVFSCVYAQLMYRIPRFELYSFISVLLATMDCIVNLVLDEKVADDEDFMVSTYGFNLEPLCSDPAEEEGLVLRKILQAIDNRPVPTNDHEKDSSNAIALRVHFQVEFYRAMQCFSGFSYEQSLSDVPQLLARMKEMASDWISYTKQHDGDSDFIGRVFDSSINRHLMTASPPRTTPLFNFDTASDYLRRLLDELCEVVELETFALPSQIGVSRDRDSHSQRHSLHIAIHSIFSFSRKLNPCILARSVLSRIMIPEYSSDLFARSDAEFRSLLATDSGERKEEIHGENLRGLESVQEGMVNTFKCLCRNRSRQRRLLLRVLRWWDHYALSCSEPAKRYPSEEMDAHSDKETLFSSRKPQASGIEQDETLEVEPKGDLRSGGGSFAEMSALQIVAYEVSSRLMIQHWLLGFECDLYQEYEYAAVFFYVAYVLTSMINATTALASKGRDGASLHPLRFALYKMDEARLWMCRALHSALTALSKGSQWDYCCGRPGSTAGSRSVMFGSEELWYEQRFGVVMALVNGPAYADHKSFVSFKQSQEESLLATGAGTDIIMLLLKDAAKGFLVARRILESAKKAAEAFPETKVTEEILQLAHVAVENSLALSQVLKMYLLPLAGQSKSAETVSHVSFHFIRHGHFPVIKFTPS